MLRPFFGYYGGKWRDAPRYPPPRFETLIEPFAGSAGYSVRHYARKVRLYDVDASVVAAWRWLIGASAEEVMALPVEVEDADALGLGPGPRAVVGYWLNRACPTPKRTPSAWMRSGLKPGCFWGVSARARIAAQVDRIRHWTIEQKSYDDLENEEATWFVDPPYSGPAGRHYRHDRIDYPTLAAWCRERRGQVIACEGGSADWLPFRTLHRARTTRHERKVELVWSRGSAQTDLFGGS